MYIKCKRYLVKMMKMEVNFSTILTTTLILGFVVLAFEVLNRVWFRPTKLEKLLRRQGLKGNPYRPLLGDMKHFISVTKSEQPKSIQFSDDLISHILPYYHQIISKHGQNCFMWFGPSPRLVISDPQLMKEILSKPDIFHKALPDPTKENVAGGLLFHEGDKWSKHRRIINPAFHMEKLKNMVPAICLSCSIMIEKWEKLVCNGDHDQKKTGEIDVWHYLEDFSGDVISRTAFGSSHEQGQRIFELQREQVKLILEVVMFISVPGWRYLPTKTNKRMTAISEEIGSLLRGIINKREQAMRRGETIADDLLNTLMESNIKEMKEHGNKKAGLSIKEVMEECKLFYLAGSETTSTLLVWTMVMLSKYQDWQARAREEVLQVFGKNEPTFDGLNRLKTVTMILQEVLRLYPSAPVTTRAPTKTVQVGDITIPVGVSMFLAIGLLHHNPNIWGDNANEFKPERFSEGISVATKNKFGYIPFSGGPRVCIGQQFAMIEAKVALAMILQCFSFELSSSYLHAPFAIITLQPQYGANLVMHKL